MKKIYLISLGVGLVIFILALITQVQASTIIGSNITTTGNVGIGTTTYPALLTVNDPAGVNPFLIGSSTAKLIVTSAGNVGIGTGAPTQKLDVAGAINASTYYTLGGTKVLNVLDNQTGGVWNTFVGYEAGLNNTKWGVTALGYRAAYNNGVNGTQSYEGAANVFIGNYAGYSHYGWDAVGVGYRALASTTSGNTNTAVGSSVLETNTTGGSNTAMGAYTMGSNTTGSFNSALGTYALQANTTGGNNSGFGAYSGDHITTGSNNTALGYAAGRNLTTGSNNIVLGYNISAPAANSVATLNIGNLIFGTNLWGSGTTVATGTVGIGTTAPSTKLDVALYAIDDGITLHKGTAKVAELIQNGGTGNGLFNLYDSSANVDVSLMANADSYLNGGNVGVGTTTPTSLVDIYTTGTTTIKLDSNSAVKGGCLKIRDYTGGGYTYCVVKSGAMTCSTVSCE